MDRTRTRGRRRLVDVDPDLLAGLTGGRAAAAREELTVPVLELRPGEWTPPPDADGRHLGFLIVDGVLSREVLVGDTISPELLGQGDVARARAAEVETLLQVQVRWSVLAEARVAALDATLVSMMARYPAVGDAMIRRLETRLQRVAVVQAIGRLGRVEARLEALFWHLADRWGRVTPEGVVLPLRLSHRLLGELVGARRPTVSVALRELAAGGKLVRRPDATWLLTGEPAIAGPAPANRLIRPRGLLLATERPADGAAPAAGPVIAPQTLYQLIADVARLRDETAERAQTLERSCATATEICSAVVLRRRRLRGAGARTA